MQTLSTNQRDWLMNGGLVTVTIPTTLLDVSVIQIDDIDILENSIVIDRKSISSNKLEIGSAETTELTFSLINDTGKFTGLKLEGAILQPRFNINGEILQCGYFTIDEKPQSGTIMQVRALDRMARFNKKYDSALVYPATLQAILTDACTQCGVSLYSSTFPNYALSITTHPDNDSTYHEVISWVAQIAGMNAFINVDGLLELKWYSGSAETIPDTAIMECEFAENDVMISGVTFDDGDNTYLAGTDTYTVDVTGNPFVLTDIATILGLINTSVNGLTYRPLRKLSCAVIMPHLWPMDLIEVIDDGVTYQSIITSNNISTASEITATGEPETIKGYAGAGMLTAHQKNIIKILANEIAGAKVTTMETELLALNEQITNSLGYYTTIITNEDGSQIVYHHDHATLAESLYIDVKPSAGGFAWTTEGWNNGNPVWQYGVTQSGSMVMRIISAVGINADWMKTGTLDAALVNVIHLNAGSITTGTLNGTHIENGAITAEKISNGTITGDKLGMGTITGDKIANGAINGERIANGAITAGNIADGTISATKMNLNTHILM